jgi:poly-beta-1,6-N-acetyl-D-glucosamine synthase
MLLLYLLFWFWLLSYSATIAFVVKLISSKQSMFLHKSKHVENLLFSVVIAARNEGRNLQLLLDDLVHQSLPLHHWEVIVVDDHSEDATFSVAESFFASLPIKVTRLVGPASGKKVAIAQGVSIARAKWLVSTDADCRVGKIWLENFLKHIENDNCIWISAPVFISQESESFFHKLQLIDFIPVMAFTEAFFKLNMPLMSNAANMAFDRSLYETGGPDTGNQLASGDDIFLMHKALKRHPKGLLFADNPESVVQAKPVNTWKELLNQRIRWAGKWTAIPDAPVKKLAVYIFIANLIACLCLLFGVITFSPLPLIFFAIKMVLEMWLILSYAKKYKQVVSGLALVFSTIFYPFFAVFIGLYATFSPSYHWKNREYSSR